MGPRAEIERKYEQRADEIEAMSPEEHIRRAAEIMGRAVSSHERSAHYLHALTHSQMATAKALVRNGFPAENGA
jgi:hypothetical protein